MLSRVCVLGFLVMACGDSGGASDGTDASATPDASDRVDAAAADAGPVGVSWQPPQAAVVWDASRAYMFRGAEYVRYDLASDTTDGGYPLAIDGRWPGLWTADIDAAATGAEGKVLMFRGAEYVQYDKAADAVDTGFPRAIAEDWPGVWPTGVDAAARDDAGIYYLFRGAEYVRYDAASSAVETGYPKPIAADFGVSWDSVDAAMGPVGGKLYLFKDDVYIRWDVATQRVDAGYPKTTRWYWPGLWDPQDGTGHPGDNLPDAVRALLVDMPSADEVAARKARCAQSITSSETDLSGDYPLYLSSVEARLGAYGCCLLRNSSGSHRFRCATDTGGPRRLDIDPLVVTHVDWARASYHSAQVSQGDFVADAGTPITIMSADDDQYFIDSVSANAATGSISGGLNIRVRFAVNGVTKFIGFSHLNGNVPGYVIDAQASGSPLATGTAFGFIGYTGNLWIGAPPDVDAAYDGNGAGLPVAHSHLWFKDDLDNHEAITAWARRALDFSGTYFFGGG